jgi:cell division protein FtsB
VHEPRSSAAWLLPLGLLLFAITCVPVRILEAEGLPRYRALRAELQQTRERNARLRDEVQQLHEHVGLLRSDPRAIERIARDELGMLRSDEIVFQFPRE